MGMPCLRVARRWPGTSGIFKKRYRPRKEEGGGWRRGSAAGSPRPGPPRRAAPPPVASRRAIKFQTSNFKPQTNKPQVQTPKLKIQKANPRLLLASAGYGAGQWCGEAGGLAAGVGGGARLFSRGCAAVPRRGGARGGGGVAAADGCRVGGWRGAG